MRVHYLVLALCALTALPAAEPEFNASRRDGDIELSVKTSFNFRMVLRGHVRIRVNNGIATLSGRVEDHTTRSLASETVELYPGVERVINNVVVSPLLSEFSDGWIAQHVHLRLLVKEGANPDAVDVSVTGGEVTLMGTVETEQQKDLTAIFAREVVGVNTVVNQLVVSDRPADRRRWDGPIDDPSITSQLQHAIRECPTVKDPTVLVTTLDGRVVITGTARSQTEKARITELAHQVRGSVSVDNQMVVIS